MQDNLDSAQSSEQSDDEMAEPPKFLRGNFLLVESKPVSSKVAEP